jgi:hypothetical protein
MVRDPASAADLAATGAELAVADLGRPGTLDGALDGASGIVATANAIAPIRRSDSASVVDAGYVELIRRAQSAGVHRAVPRGVRAVVAVPADAAVQRGLADPRRQRDPAARRAADDARPAYPTLRRFRRSTGRTIERRGVMGLNRLIATSETDWDTSDAAAELGLGPLRTVEEILRAKAAMPPIR